MTRTFRDLLYEVGDTIRQNAIVLTLIGFFVYWTFYAGRLNLALTALVGALALMIACRVVYHFNRSTVARLLYRTLVVMSAILIFAALAIQTVRFIYVFLPGLTEPTLPKILVRVGIVTATLWAFAVPTAFMYYLYVHDMTRLIWNGSVDRFLQSTLLSNRALTARRVRHANLLLWRTLLWGGALSATTLSIGVVAWAIAKAHIF